jgi:predicted acyltransferase
MADSVSKGNAGRLVSLDQFRGLTILGMFAVQYAGCLEWSSHLDLLRHNNTFLSFADVVLPGFLFAAGMSLRLTLVRRMNTPGSSSIYTRLLRRGLVLVALSLFFTSDRWLPSAKEAFHDGGWLDCMSIFLKRGLWEPLAIIGLASLWVLPVMTTRARTRVLFLVTGLVLHALLCQAFYYHYLLGVPNRLDDWLGTQPRTGYEGGLFGLLTWAVPLLVGSLAYDVVARESPGMTARVLFAWGTALLAFGYGLSCLANSYPTVQTPSNQEGVIIENGEIAASPVVPPFAESKQMPISSFLAAPPFVQPAPEQQRQLNYWLMSKRVVTPSLIVSATGVALAAYAFFVLMCDLKSLRLGLLRTFGQNPLAAYILNLYMVGPLVRRFWPDDRGWLWGLGHMAVWFGITYLIVLFMERRRIFLRL